MRCTGCLWHRLKANCLQLQVASQQLASQPICCVCSCNELTGVFMGLSLPADAADKAAADGIEELSLGQKAKAFLKAVVSLLYFARFDASFITLRARTVGPQSACSAFATFQA